MNIDEGRKREKEYPLLDRQKESSYAERQRFKFPNLLAEFIIKHRFNVYIYLSNMFINIHITRNIIFH